MNFLHTDFHGGPKNVALVTLDGQANVMLIDNHNYRAYRNGEPFQYVGGLAKQSPVQLSPPHQGHWHVVVDLGGYAGSVRTSIRILRREWALC